MIKFSKKQGISLLASLILSLSTSLNYAQQGKLKIIKEEYLFETGKHFAQCHASSLVESRQGELLATWFAGSHEGNKDVAIWGSIFIGDQWTKPIIWADGLLDGHQYPCWNPVLFRAKDSSKIFLYYKIGPSPRAWWGMVKTSVDGGQSWSQPKHLPADILGPIKNKPLELANGLILAPSSVELSEDRWVAHVEISDPDQTVWRSYPIDHQSVFNVIQPSLIAHNDGRIQALCRSKEGSVMSAWSTDQGKTWSSLAKTNLINPNSATDALRIGKDLLIVYNPDVPGKEWWEGRTKLRLAHSIDGINWVDLLQLEDQEVGEFSYPSIIQDAQGLIHICYTANRKNIKHYVLVYESN